MESQPFTLPIARFTMPPSITLLAPTVFNNQSEGADSYFWQFGDGTFSSESSATHTYSAGGSYQVALQAHNSQLGVWHETSAIIVIEKANQILSYETATLATIQSKATQMRNTPIDGSNNALNQLTVGQLLFFRTKQGRFGKMEIQEYGYNLKIRFTTYNLDGTIVVSANQWLIKGTWTYDLDLGLEAGKLTDFWWNQADNIIRSLVPQNGSVFMVEKAENTNRIIDFKIVEDTSVRLIADISYAYSGNSGDDNIFMSMIMATDGQISRLFGYGPGKVTKGTNTVRCTLNINNAPINYKTNQLQFGMYIGGKDYFHTEFKSYPKIWNAGTEPATSANKILGFKIIEDTPTRLIADVSYSYSGNSGDDNIFMSMIMAIDGQVSRFYGYGPGKVLKGANTVRCVLNINNAPANYKTNQLQFGMYIGGKDYIYTEFHNYVKTWN
jgi:PKD domain